VSRSRKAEANNTNLGWESATYGQLETDAVKGNCERFGQEVDRKENQKPANNRNLTL